MPRRKSYEIRVTTIQKHGKTYLKHIDPLTGRQQVRVATKSTPSEIAREAGAWENELREGSSRRILEGERNEQARKAASAALTAASTPRSTSWEQFRERFFSEHLSSLAAHSIKAFQSALRQFEKYCGDLPLNVNDLTSSHIGQFAAAYRATGVSEITISSRLTHLRAALEWAKIHGGILQEVPQFPRVKRARKGQRVRPAKGRAIREDEFESILAAVAAASSGEHDGIAITKRKRFLEALYWGGLRLEECLDLSWDDSDGLIWVDLKRFNHPMLIIPGSEEKGGKDRIYPVAPEFAKILEDEWVMASTAVSASTPDHQPHGPVFPLIVRRSRQNKDRDQVGAVAASAMVIDICRAAGVFTHFRGHGEQRKKQPAGAQDFRRAFGERWARRVKPQVLQQMMRHENIETTMRYYVDLSAEDLARDIYAAFDESKIDAGVTTKSPEMNKP